MAAQGNRGVSRVLQKLEKSVTDGNYYEAHQMYRTLYFRYIETPLLPIINWWHKMLETSKHNLIISDI